jgi:hypothetical protein
VTRWSALVAAVVALGLAGCGGGGSPTPFDAGGRTGSTVASPPTKPARTTRAKRSRRRPKGVAPVIDRLPPGPRKGDVKPRSRRECLEVARDLARHPDPRFSTRERLQTLGCGTLTP